MSMQPDPQSALNRFSTREHDNLHEVVEMLTTMERLRDAGLEFDQIADRMGASHHDPPGGGSWNPALVAKVLGVVNTVRSEQGQTADDVRPDEKPPQPSPSAPEPSAEADPSPPELWPTGPDPIAVDTGRPAGPPTTSLSPLGQRRAEPSASQDTDPGTAAGRAMTVEVTDHELSRHEPDPGHSAPERKRRRLVAASMVALLTVVGGVAAAALLVDDSRPSSTTQSNALASEPTTATSTAGLTATTAGPDRTEGTDGSASGQAGGSEQPGTETADDEDTMTIRVEPEAPELIDPETGETIRAASATIRADGLLHLEGAFPSEAVAQRHIEGMADVFGRTNIVESYDINPAAPLPRASDVALDKPVLFESGTATIEPSYLPFLEACGDVLRLNPQITMSIAAFTDSSGPAEFNLELSRQRAQAIFDFYRSVDVDASQLQPLAFGEVDPVAGNDTEAGRRQNRRAMLRLLGVLAGQPGAAAN